MEYTFLSMMAEKARHSVYLYDEDEVAAGAEGGGRHFFNAEFRLLLLLG